jgi:methyltransferase
MVHLLLAALVLQRLGELWLARRNTARLMAAGAVEVGAGHYPLFVLLHGTWIAAMALSIPAETPVQAGPLTLLGLVMAARVWVVASLGRFWTTRIVTLPGAARVRSGPYRFLDHPNYLVVVAEIALVPMVFGAWDVAVAFSTANGALLAHRISVEDKALTARDRCHPERSEGPHPAPPDQTAPDEVPRSLRSSG